MGWLAAGVVVEIVVALMILLVALRIYMTVIFVGRVVIAVLVLVCLHSWIAAMYTWDPPSVPVVLSPP